MGKAQSCSMQEFKKTLRVNGKLSSLKHGFGALNLPDKVLLEMYDELYDKISQDISRAPQSATVNLGGKSTRAHGYRRPNEMDLARAVRRLVSANDLVLCTDL